LARAAAFFHAIAREGSKLARLTLLTVIVGGALTVASAFLFDIPREMAIGLLAGAFTSTPALAAATESAPSAAANMVIIGYGVAYPIGVIGVVIFVQLLPRLFKFDFGRAEEEEKKNEPAEEKVETALVEVTNPNLVGQRIYDSGLSNFSAVLVSRVLHEGRLDPVQWDDHYELGVKLFLVGKKRELKIAIDFIGKEVHDEVVKDVEKEQRRLVVTSKNVAGKSIGELSVLKNFGAVIVRIRRLGIDFIPNNDTQLEVNDQLRAVGKPESLKRLAEFIGHKSIAFDRTDILSIAFGIVLGVIVGNIPLSLPGTEPITLGLAGGTLLVALLLGHFGKMMGIIGYIPRPVRMTLQELGLIFFLADSGIKGGKNLVATVQSSGFEIFIVAVLMTVTPMLVSLFISMKFLKMDLLNSLGSICGSMTSTPALGAITSKTEAQSPLVSYATAYPIALILMTVVAKVLILILP
jgi:putative transport protein